MSPVRFLVAPQEKPFRMRRLFSYVVRGMRRVLPHSGARKSAPRCHKTKKERPQKLRSLLFDEVWGLSASAPRVENQIRPPAGVNGATRHVWQRATSGPTTCSECPSREWCVQRGLRCEDRLRARDKPNGGCDATAADRRRIAATAARRH